MMILRLIGCIMLCELAGVIGSLATSSAIPTWYAQLKKPAFTPPGWIFGPVWITLYAMMGIALFLIWQKGSAKPGVKSAIIVFMIQLILNATWSLIFFGMKAPLAAFFEIVVLWIGIVVTTFLFMRISIPAGILLIPYLLWVSFASVLNLSIALLNR